MVAVVLWKFSAINTVQHTQRKRDESERIKREKQRERKIIERERER